MDKNQILEKVGWRIKVEPYSQYGISPHGIILSTVDDLFFKEIERTIEDNHLPFQKIEDADKKILVQRLYNTFVIGNPYALWLSFRYVPYSIDCNMEDPYFHLQDLIDKNTVFYFFIDYEHVGFVVYKAKLSDIHIFIGNCEGLDEYYLVTEDFMELYSITDHDDLLYIDVRKNEMRNDN